MSQRVAAPVALALVLGVVPAARAAAPCDPLPPPAGTVVQVATEGELQQAVRNLVSGTTILLADGTYDLTQTLHLQGGLTDVALRGASGDRDAVVLRGRGMSNGNFGNVPHGVLVGDATDVLIADLTIRDVYFHAVQVQGERGASGLRLRNLRLLDAGEQLVKGSTAGPPGPYGDDGVVECSLLEYTDRARSWYTNGVDVLAGAGWIVRDNVFLRIRAPVGELAGPAVLFWRNSLDTVVERNAFIDCDRGVALGLATPDGNSRDGNTTYDHQGGVVRNNVFYRSAGAPTGDVGISVNFCRDFRILHNTVVQEGSFPWTIEYRFDVSDGLVANNLTDGPILSRNGATATLSGNVETATPAWFVDQPAADLHLTAGAVGALDAGVPLPEVVDDFDGEARPVGGAPDVGADEAPAPCTLPAGPVVGVRASRQGPDVVLAWDAVAGIPAYHVWYVTDRRDGARTTVDDAPPAIGVIGCSPPDPAPAPTCRDADAVGRGAATHFYRVRTSCGPGSEGP